MFCTISGSQINLDEKQAARFFSPFSLQEKKRKPWAEWNLYNNNAEVGTEEDISSRSSFPLSSPGRQRLQWSCKHCPFPISPPRENHPEKTRGTPRTAHGTHRRSSVGASPIPQIPAATRRSWQLLLTRSCKSCSCPAAPPASDRVVSLVRSSVGKAGR